MMRQYKIAVAALFALLLMSACTQMKEAGGDTAEHIFNMANEAIARGDEAVAIDLFYKLNQDYGAFKKYRADVLYRLGTLLYKTERYDESEKVLSMFVSKFQQDARLKKAYEMLLYIYMQETHDEAKAQKVRDQYAGKFGNNPTLKQIDKTMTVLSGETQEASALLALDAVNIGIIGSAAVNGYDREFYPVRNYILKSVRSPDGKFTVEKKKKAGNYYLYIDQLPAKGQPIRIDKSSGGYAPQWSWDSKYVVFTSMDWATDERRVRIYDVKKKVARDLFSAPGLEPLLCISPDSSKIIFTYNGKLWIMNSNGNGVSLLSKSMSAKKMWMIAWAREGGRIIYSNKSDKSLYYECRLGRREIEAIK